MPKPLHPKEAFEIVRRNLETEFSKNLLRAIGPSYFHYSRRWGITIHSKAKDFVKHKTAIEQHLNSLKKSLGFELRIEVEPDPEKPKFHLMPVDTDMIYDEGLEKKLENLPNRGKARYSKLFFAPDGSIVVTHYPAGDFDTMKE